MADEESQSMCKSHFLVRVSKDAIAKEYGAQINNWPAANYWAMVSSVKCSIRDDQIPALMAKYNIAKLSDYSPQPRELVMNKGGR